MSNVNFHAVGRRKKAIARVRLIPGEGNIIINKRSLDDYFGYETLKTVVRQPLVLTDTLGKIDGLGIFGIGGSLHKHMGTAVPAEACQSSNQNRRRNHQD